MRSLHDLLRRAALTLAVALGLAAGAGGARADEAREPMTVLGIEAVEVPLELGTGLTAALKRALRKRERVALMPGKDLVEMRFVFGCTDERKLGECLASACRSLVVNRVLFGSVREVSMQGRKTGAYFVRLRVLDVNRGAIEPVEVHETVLAERLRMPLLDEAADRWVAVLIGGASPRGDLAAAATTAAGKAAGQPAVAEGAVAGAPGSSPAAAQPIPLAAVQDERPGRRLLVGGVVAGVLAVVAFGVSIGTWRRYVDEQPTAHQALADLAAQQPAYYQQNRAFFDSPTCDLPALSSLPAGADGAYRQSCGTGQSFAGATTGLIVTGAVLGALGVTGIVVGNHLDREERRRAAAGGSPRTSSTPARTAPPAPSLAARLAVGPGGLGLSF